MCHKDASKKKTKLLKKLAKMSKKKLAKLLKKK